MNRIILTHSLTHPLFTKVTDCEVQRTYQIYTVVLTIQGQLPRRASSPPTIRRDVSKRASRVPHASICQGLRSDALRLFDVDDITMNRAYKNTCIHGTLLRHSGTCIQHTVDEDGCRRGSNWISIYTLNAKHMQVYK